MVLDLENGPAGLARPQFTQVLLQATAPSYVIQQPGQAPPALARPTAQPVAQPVTSPAQVRVVNAIPVATSVEMQSKV